MIKLISVNNLWLKGLCASIYQGSWISKTSNFHCGFVNVEDFTDRSHNVSRALGKQEIQRIYNLISHSICACLFLGGTLPVPQLKHLLFDPKSSPQAITDEAASLAGTRTVVPYSLPNSPSRQAKKRRWNDITGRKQAVDPWKAQEERVNLRSDPWEERKSQVDQHRRDAWNGWGGNNELKKYWPRSWAASNSNQVPSLQQQLGQQLILGSPSVFDSSRAHLVSPNAAGWPSWRSLISCINRR